MKKTQNPRNEISLDKDYIEQIKSMIVLGIFFLCLAVFFFNLFLIDFQTFGDPLSLSFVVGFLMIGSMIIYLSRRELQGRSMSRKGDMLLFLGLIFTFSMMFTPISLGTIHGHLGYPICLAGTFLVFLGITGICLVMARIITYASESI